MAESLQVLNRRVKIRGTNTDDPTIGDGGGGADPRVDEIIEQLETEIVPAINNIGLDIKRGLVVNDWGGTFNYIQIGKLVLGSGTLQTQLSQGSNTALVGNLPRPMGRTPKACVFVYEAGFGDFYLDGSGTIIKRTSTNPFTTVNILVIYMTE